MAIYHLSPGPTPDKEVIELRHVNENLVNLLDMMELSGGIRASQLDKKVFTPIKVKKDGSQKVFNFEKVSLKGIIHQFS